MAGLTELLQSFKDAPIEESLPAIAQQLAAAALFVAVEKATAEDVKFLVAPDNSGALWVYAFSDQAELLKAFPAGAAFAEMRFVDLLATIAPDLRFGGIFLNVKSEGMYVIPRALFAAVDQLTRLSATPAPAQKVGDGR